MIATSVCTVRMKAALSCIDIYNQQLLVRNVSVAMLQIWSFKMDCKAWFDGYRNSTENCKNNQQIFPNCEYVHWKFWTIPMQVWYRQIEDFISPQEQL